MKLNQSINTVITEGEVGSGSSMRLSANAHAHIIAMLTERTYKDPIGSIVREYTSNAVDAHRMINNPDPVIVSLTQKDGQYSINFVDKGTGLDEESFYRLIGGVGESDKQDRDDLIGAFGLGSKSAFSLVDSFYYECIKDGFKREFIIYKSSPTPRLEKIFEKETTEPNGVTVSIPVGYSYSRLSEISTKMRQQLAYFSNVYFDNWYQAIPNDFAIYRSEYFQWSELCQDKNIHISLDDVYYPIDYNKLEIDPINIPVALRFKLTDGLVPIPNREDITYTEEAIELIKEKIKKVADFFVNTYNEQKIDLDSFIKAFHQIDVKDKSIILNGKSIIINGIVEYSTIEACPVSVKGITLKTAKFYKDRMNTLLNTELYCVGRSTVYGGWDEGLPWYKMFFNQDTYQAPKFAFLSSHPVGNFKEYLKDRCKNTFFFVRRQSIKLGFPVSDKIPAGESYYKTLDIGDEKDKTKWKPLVMEWKTLFNSMMKEKVKDLTKEENSPHYEAWLNAKREAQRLRRNLDRASGKIPALLNKKKGDITIASAKYSVRADKKVVFDKKVWPVDKLYKTKCLNVIVDWDDEVEAGIGKDLLLIRLKNVNLVKIGNFEIRKLPEIHNFIKLIDFMGNKDCKPFKRLATCIYIQSMLDIHEKMDDYKEYLKGIKISINEDLVILEKYKADNGKEFSQLRSSFYEMILEVAEMKDLFDMEVLHVINRVATQLRQLDFLSLLPEPYKLGINDKTTMAKLINKLLIFNKLHKGAFDDYELVPKTVAIAMEGSLVDYVDKTIEEVSEETQAEEVLEENEVEYED